MSNHWEPRSLTSTCVMDSWEYFADMLCLMGVALTAIFWCYLTDNDELSEVFPSPLVNAQKQNLEQSRRDRSAKGCCVFNSTRQSTSGEKHVLPLSRRNTFNRRNQTGISTRQSEIPGGDRPDFGRASPVPRFPRTGRTLLWIPPSHPLKCTFPSRWHVTPCWRALQD